MEPRSVVARNRGTMEGGQLRSGVVALVVTIELLLYEPPELVELPNKICVREVVQQKGEVYDTEVSLLLVR